MGRKNAVSAGGATFSPVESPRPRYPPLTTVLLPTLIRLVRFPFLCTVVALATVPAYQWLEDSLCWQHAYDTLASAMGEMMPNYLQPADMLFTFGMTISLTMVYLVQNGFFFICDHFDLLQQYRLPRVPAQEPSRQLVHWTLWKAFVVHFLSVNSVPASCCTAHCCAAAALVERSGALTFVSI